LTCSLLTFAVAVAIPAAEQRHDRYDLSRLLKPLTTSAPRTYAASAADKGDIRAFYYDGLPYQGHPTRVFAYLGIPSGANARHKVPGMVLAHGGGGTAYSEWVGIWNRRGYAAIAMDLEGHGPEPNSPWAGPERVGVFHDAGLPLTNQWMYHAVADIMLAHSLLAAQPGVDAKRIGVTGISWGGVLSSLVAGVDDRFKLAAPVYGCGFLYESSGYFGKSLHEASPTEFSQRQKWDPAYYFTGTKMPVLWVNGDQDAHFSVNITSRSHEAVKGLSILSIHPAMVHAHLPGWDVKSVPEIYAFADCILRGGKALPTITRQPSGTSVVVRYSSPCPITNASVWFVTEPLTRRSTDRRAPTFTWHRRAAAIDANSHTVTATLPPEAKTYYVNLMDDRGLTVSSNLIHLGDETGASDTGALCHE